MDLLAVIVVSLLLRVVRTSNAPPGVETWCGKAYKSTDRSFSPGGWLEAPAYSKDALIDLRLRPRMNIYTSDDEYGSFLVDVPVSHRLGQLYHKPGVKPFTTLIFDIRNAESGKSLVSQEKVTVNTTSNEFSFSLAHLHPRETPYKITFHGASADNRQAYTAHTSIYRLPKNQNGGSTVILDSLHGNLLVPGLHSSPARNHSSALLQPLFPYSFYASWDYFKNHPDRVRIFKSHGYNIVHVVPDSTLPYGFEPDALASFLDACDEAGLWVMYDMRWTYQNHSSVRHQASKLKHHRSLLLWYTGDEPDGTSDPLDATVDTYKLLKSLDPYHPVSLVLNCYNYHYAAYAAGADIIMSDVYPISNNLSYSTEFHTPCNRTYGDCGCDDCFLSHSGFEAITEREDRLKAYQSWIPGAPPKPRWGVPQAFGKETYWPRYPTAKEEVVMTMLRVNHGVRGIVMWTYPTSLALRNVTSRLGALLAGSQVARFTLGADPARVVVTGATNVEAAVWRVGKRMLVSVVSMQYGHSPGRLSLEVPGKVRAVGKSLLGESWNLRAGRLLKTGLDGLECDLFVVTLE